MCDHEDQHQTTVIATDSTMTEREQKRVRAVSCEEHEVRLLELQFAREEAAAGMVTALAMTVIMVVTDLIVTDWMTVTRMVRI
jgi:hypothetical protein